jgi:hypothetical protein
MKTQSKLPGLLLALAITAQALPASADTLGPYTLNYTGLMTGAGAILFSFPRFDPSLGSLQSVGITFNFSGTVVGTATGVSQSSSMNGTITHWVFFDFTDLSDNVFIAEPSLSLTAGIPAGAQNATIAFGPQFVSSSRAFSVGSGDPRFNAWANGPGDVSGSLTVYFTNTTDSFGGLQFFPGTDSGVYGGSLSVAYSYEPVPEPDSLALAAAGLLMLAATKCKRRKAA